LLVETAKVYAHVIINMGMPRVHTFESRLLQLRVLTLRAIDISFSLFVSIHPYLLISIYLCVRICWSKKMRNLLDTL